MMLAINETATGVRLQCESCGAHTTLRRFERHRTRVEGAWVECRVCGYRSKLVEGHGNGHQPVLQLSA